MNLIRYISLNQQESITLQQTVMANARAVLFARFTRHIGILPVSARTCLAKSGVQKQDSDEEIKHTVAIDVAADAGLPADHDTESV